MIGNDDLEYILRNADDLVVVAEVYPAETTPTDDGFDPADALALFADSQGIFFLGHEYKCLLTNISGVKRTISPEINSASVEFSNVSKEIAEFEFAVGFEGLILVIRQFSLSLSDTLEKSLIWSVGKCEKPSSGTKKALGVTSKDVVESIDTEMPRRTFQPDDPKGRVPSDPEYEGFIFMPQYGITIYSTREKRGSILGFFGLKKDVWHALPYSSFSDLDANRVVPECFGRTQMAGVHGGYIDIGGWIRIQTFFCEGEIGGFFNVRSASPQMPLNPLAYHESYGKPGEANGEADMSWVAPGIYSRTANIRCEASGSQVSVIEPAPDVIAGIIGRLIPTPEGNAWTTPKPSDNAAAITRFCLTSPDYRNLHPNWIDDESFADVYRSNDEIIFDSSNSDFLFIPDTDNFADFAENGALVGNFLRSTGAVDADYFKYLKGEISHEQFFKRPARAVVYSSGESFAPIVPPDGPDPGDPNYPYPGGGTTGGGTTGGTAPTLSYFLRRRYTCNTPVTAKVKLIDFLHETIFTSSRLFFSMASNGRKKLNQKKPVDWALGTGEFDQNALQIALDDVSPFVSSQKGFLLVDVHTNESEVKKVVSAVYPAANNSITVAASANITVAAFSGAAGGATPATATLTVDEINAGEESSFTIGDIETIFTATANDTTATVAGFIYASINAHPILKRKFKAELQSSSVVKISVKSGIVNLNEPLLFNHSAPVESPADMPFLSVGSGGSLKAGLYRVAYSYQNQRGQTLLSPYAEITIAAGEKINVDSVSVPAGATSINWYVGPEANSRKLRLFKNNSGAAFAIDKVDLPKLTAPLPPDLNRTGAECIRVALVFSDYAEPRTGSDYSDVVDSTYKWQLGKSSETINELVVNFRDAVQDFRPVKLVLSDEAHQKKTGKVSKKEINGQAIDNFNQAYRIGAGLLAEGSDANFLYNWSGTREALLLEEGDVVCVTDSGARIVNQPLFLETLEPKRKPFIQIALTGRKYSTTLFDDSVAERRIPVAIETPTYQNYLDNQIEYVATNFVETRIFDAGTADLATIKNALATVMDDLQNNRK